MNPTTPKQAWLARFEAERGNTNNIVIPRWSLTLCENDLVTALFLKQCVYWGLEAKSPKGFYHSYTQWSENCHLTRHQVEASLKAVNRLAGEAVITTSVAYANGANRTHYLVNWQVLENWFCKILQDREVVLQKSAKHLAENDTTLSENSQDGSCENQQDLNSKSITVNQTPDETVDSFVPPATAAAATPTNETGNIIPFSSDEPLVLKALCELCGISGPNASKRARTTLQKLAAMTPGDQPPPNAKDFIRFRYYMKAVNARPEPPTLAYIEDGWQRYLEWITEPHAWTARYWRERGWPKGVSREQLLNAHDLMAYHPALMEVAE